MPPINDNFASRQVLSGSSGTFTEDTTGATSEVGEPTPVYGSGDSSVWFEWVPPTSVTVQIDTWGTDFDTVLEIYTGAAFGGLVLVGASDDTPGHGAQSTVVFDATAGVSYKIRVNPYSPGDAGNLVLHWGESTIPSISSLDPNIADPGDTITIVGAHLSAATYVYLAFVGFVAFTVVDDSHLTFLAPTVSVDVYVYIDGYIGPLHLAIIEPPPVLVSITPRAVPSSPFSSVLLHVYGENLLMVTALSIGGAEILAEDFYSFTDTEIVTFKPPGARTGFVVATSMYGRTRGPAIEIIEMVAPETKAFISTYSPTQSIVADIFTPLVMDSVPASSGPPISIDFYNPAVIFGPFYPVDSSSFILVSRYGNYPADQMTFIEVSGPPDSLAFEATVSGHLGMPNGPGFCPISFYIGPMGVGVGSGLPPDFIDDRNPVLTVWTFDADTKAITGSSYQLWDRGVILWPSTWTLFCVLSHTQVLAFPNAGFANVGFFTDAQVDIGGTVCHIITISGATVVSIKPTAHYELTGFESGFTDNYNFCPEDAGSHQWMYVMAAERVSDTTALIVYKNVFSFEVWARLVSTLDDEHLSLGARVSLGSRGNSAFEEFVLVDRVAGDFIVNLGLAIPYGDPSITGEYGARARLRIVGGVLTLIETIVRPYPTSSGGHQHGWGWTEKAFSWLDLPHTFVSHVAEWESEYVPDSVSSHPGYAVISDDPSDTSFVFNGDRVPPYDSATYPGLAAAGYPPLSFDVRDMYEPPAYAGILLPSVLQVFNYPGMIDTMLYVGVRYTGLPTYTTEFGTMVLPKRVDTADVASLWKLDVTVPLGTTATGELLLRILGVSDPTTGRLISQVKVGSLWADDEKIWVAGPSSAPGDTAELAIYSQEPFALLETVDLPGEVHLIASPAGGVVFAMVLDGGYYYVIRVVDGVITGTFLVQPGTLSGWDPTGLGNNEVHGFYMPRQMTVARLDEFNEGIVFIADGTGVLTILSTSGGGSVSHNSVAPGSALIRGIAYCPAIDRLAILWSEPTLAYHQPIVEFIGVDDPYPAQIPVDNGIWSWASPNYDGNSLWTNLVVDADGRSVWFVLSPPYAPGSYYGHNLVHLGPDIPVGMVGSYDLPDIDSAPYVGTALPPRYFIRGLWVPSAVRVIPGTTPYLRQRQRDDGPRVGQFASSEQATLRKTKNTYT